MPEGDAIYRAARALHRALAGGTLVRFESVLPQLTRVHEDTPLTGRTIERVRSAGKHLLIELSGGLVLRTHMRMSGSWHLYRIGERWLRPRSQMRIVLATATFEAVAFNVPVAEFRSTGVAAAAQAPRQMTASDPLAALGPDLLHAAFDPAAAAARLRTAGGRPIGEALLDQRLLAGIGNVYKSEVCFLCRVNPFTDTSRLSEQQLLELVTTARRLLMANVRDDAPGRIVTRRTLRSLGGRFGPDEDHWVYGRAGRPCHRCGAIVRRAMRSEAGRVTYWCPACAPE